MFQMHGMFLIYFALVLSVTDAWSGCMKKPCTSTSAMFVSTSARNSLQPLPMTSIASSISSSQKMATILLKWSNGCMQWRKPRVVLRNKHTVLA